MPAENESRARTGERRHLTAMFCDIVGSSRFAGQLDPEVWDEILSEYHRTCANVVHRFEGHVFKTVGDGLIAFFGWPVAHENDAYPAVRAGLSVIDAMRELNTQLERDRGIRLRVRIGLDTGLVVIGKTGDATGQALNVASRLQGVAIPDTVVISSTTFNLVRAYFTFDDLGPQNLANVDTPVHAYHVIAHSGVDRRFDAVGQSGLTPLIGRQSDLDVLLNLWARTEEGHSQIVFITGDAGIGKSRLVKVLRDRIDNSIEFRCSQYDSQSALFPVVRHLERLGLDRVKNAGDNLDRLQQKLQELGFSAPEVLPLLASQFSLPLPDRHSPADGLSAVQKRQQTLNVLAEWLLKEAQRQPLMAVWEDLHWADPSTIEFLGLINERVTKSVTPLLTLITFRPDEFKPPWAGTEVLLRSLERPDVEEMIGKITTGRSLPRQVVNQIIEKAEGVPLYVEEFVQAFLDTGSVPKEGHTFAIAQSSSPIEEALQASLMSRLDRLGEAKTIAQRGAILGRTFSQDLLHAVLEMDVHGDEQGPAQWPGEERCLAQLVEAGVLRQPRTSQTSYEFKHALIQKAAYESVLNKDKQTYHKHTAQVLETRFAHVAETQPELVAQHFTKALQLGPAFDYWLKAAKLARDRSANREAIQHVAEGLKIIIAMPESSDRADKELLLRIASFTPVIAVEGYAAQATADTAEKALLLCRELGDVDRMFPVLYTLWANRIVGARYQDALSLSEEFSREAEKQQDPAPRLISLRVRGISLCMDGDLAGAELSLKDSLALYEPHRHGALKNQGYGQDPRATAKAFLALVRWLEGYSDDAAENSRTSLELADEARHTNTWGYVRCFGASTFEAFRGDVARTAEHTSALIDFAEREWLPVWLAYARVLHGWALAQTDRIADGIEEMKAGLVDFEDVESTTASNSLRQGFMKSFLLSRLAEAYATVKRPEEALATLDVAWSFAEATGEKFWKAELQRLRGEMILQSANRLSGSSCQKAEDCFRYALEIASAQGAKALELRAAMSLNRLWRQSKPVEARQVLTEVYEWFTEGFDSPDLVKARRLLDDLAVT